MKTLVLHCVANDVFVHEFDEPRKAREFAQSRYAGKAHVYTLNDPPTVSYINIIVATTASMMRQTQAKDDTLGHALDKLVKATYHMTDTSTQTGTAFPDAHRYARAALKDAGYPGYSA